ncbi:MAG: M23 family metallopeptidase [Planctomycetota bacterium]|nr:MAG: M23 family metallopeptidase [Planctomycetota bacterium]
MGLDSSVFPALALLFGLGVTACGEEVDPGQTVPARPVHATTPRPGAPPQFDLPIDSGEAAFTAYGIWPYGVHGGGHPEGHPGYDLECRPGAEIRAMAPGRVVRVEANTAFPGQWDVTLRHDGGWQTRYGHLTGLADDLPEGAEVQRGQRLGGPGAVDGFHMIHFVIEGPYECADLTLVLTAKAVPALQEIWRRAAYSEELCEPMLVNVRGAEFPLVATWRRAGSEGPDGIRFTRTDPQASEYRYEILEGHRSREQGGVRVRPLPGWSFSELDLLPDSGGPPRLGLYDVVGPAMRIRWAAERPASLENAWAYEILVPLDGSR